MPSTGRRAVMRGCLRIVLFWAVRGGASDDARVPAANGSIFSRAGENVFSHLARTGPWREKLRSFLP
ncbi:hypothetical protein A8F41_34350 [Burkholderia cenocepacia]|nr:hypothetical protein A8F41_34350 [Burkholderia cenocepacia]